MSFLSVIFILLFQHSISFGWGQFGHQQINAAAVDLLDSKTAIGTCFQNGEAKELISRYASTPDLEWKDSSFARGLTVKDIENRKSADCYEHQLHFFAQDAFSKQDKDGQLITQLPTDADYAKAAYEKYLALLKDNTDYVNKVSHRKDIAPDTIKTANVAAQGTAPWRSRQLYLLAVSAMKKADFKLAALYLGTLGHYIGDMSQPFHTNLNFDGAYPEDAKHAGIHHEIDTGLLGTLNENKFSIKAEAVKEFSNNSNLLTGDEVPGSVIDLARSGYPLINTLLKSYKAQCDEANTQKTMAKRPKRKIASTPYDEEYGPEHEDTRMISPQGVDASQAIGQEYCVNLVSSGRPKVRAIGGPREQRMADEDLPPKVINVLKSRLAMSSALLARLWISAWTEAGKPSFGDCSKWKFDMSYILQNYPKPDYYPNGFTGVTKPQCAGYGVDDRSPSSLKKQKKNKRHKKSKH